MRKDINESSGIMKKTKILALLLISFICINAQQNILDYSLLDYSGRKLFSSSISNESLKNLTDKDISTFYEVKGFSGELVITLETNNPVIIKGYSLVSSDSESADPKDFKLEYSDNGSNWARIGTSVYGHKFSGRYLSSFISVNSNSKASNFHRLVISAVNGGSDLKITELQFFGYPATLDDDLTKTESVTVSGNHSGSGSSVLSNLLSNDLNQIFRLDNQKTCRIEYTFDNPVKIEGYSLISTTANNEQHNLRSWNLSASNDGENWTTLDVRANKNVLPLTNNMQIYRLADNSEKINWGARADFLQEKMLNLFWKQYGTGYYLTHSWHNDPDSVNKGFNYWWMAHTLDVFVDAYARTENKDYQTKMRSIYNAMVSYGRNTYGRNDLWNGFFDDMEWMALACIRANEVYPGNPMWKDAAVQLWNWIKVGWNTDYHGGGIQWVDARPEAKNACSNAPAIIIAARLYNLTGQQDYLDWAHRIFDWMNDGLILESGLVKDSFSDDWTFTYNQGTWIGACLEMYKITNEQKYYNIAMKTADYILNTNNEYSPYGILYNNEGGGDGGLFKGILMRYLSQWILSGKLDEKRQEQFINYFIANGKSLWESALNYSTGIVGNAWFERELRISQESKRNGYESSIHLSAVMLIELLDELQRNGFIDENGLAAGVLGDIQKTHKYFRLDVEANNGGNAVELARWQLFSSLGTPNDNKEIREANIPVKVYVQDRRLILINESINPLNFEIFDLQGRKIYMGKIMYSEEVELDKGIYIVRIKNDASDYSQKVIIL